MEGQLATCQSTKATCSVIVLDGSAGRIVLEPSEMSMRFTGKICRRSKVLAEYSAKHDRFSTISRNQISALTTAISGKRALCLKALAIYISPDPKSSQKEECFSHNLIFIQPILYHPKDRHAINTQPHRPHSLSTSYLREPPRGSFPTSSSPTPPRSQHTDSSHTQSPATSSPDYPVPA